MFVTLAAFAGLALLLLLLYRILEPFLVPIGWAGVIVIATFPVYERLRIRLGRRREMAPAIMVAAVALLVVVPATLLTLTLAQEATGLYQRLGTEEGLKKLVDVAHLERDPRFGPAIASAVRRLEALGVSPAAEIGPAAKRVTAVVADWAGAAVRNFLMFLVQLLIVLFAIYFLYRDGREVQARFWACIPVTDERRREFKDVVVRILPSVLFAILLTALIQGALASAGFLIAGIGSPVFFGALTCVASLVPVVGTMLVWLPAGLWLLATGDTTWGIFLLAWGAVVVGSADQFLRPLLSGKQTGLSVPLMMLGSLGGLGAFGMLGLVLGPLVLGIALTLVGTAEAESGD